MSVRFGQCSCNVPATKTYTGVDVKSHSLLILVTGETSGRFHVKASLIVGKPSLFEINRRICGSKGQYGRFNEYKNL